MNNNPLNDKIFLEKLMCYNLRENYVRIIALTKDEQVIETIEGRVSSGQVSIDGKSTVRRTCNLTMVAKDVNINNYYWGLHNKFKLEIGLKNMLDSRYPDIIWFKMGIYVINSFNCSNSANNYTISISGKDKMCLLNGEVSGTLPFSVDFGIEEITDTKTKTTTYREIPIKEILREAIQNYGNELAQNIIINDIKDWGLEVWEYRGDIPIYFIYNSKTQAIMNMTINGDQECKDENGKNYKFSNPDNNPNKIVYLNLNNLMSSEATKVYIDDKRDVSYQIIKLEQGTLAGYKPTELVYAGDLILNVGEPLTSLLDKIKNMLGNFEYFYNLDGQFVFQQKKNYIDVPYSGYQRGNEDNGEGSSEQHIPVPEPFQNTPIFTFSDSKLITAFQNTPNFANLKNDFAIWGKRKTTNGSEIPIHVRYAIDKKPKRYKTLAGVVYTSDKYDWRELIYQMALDYRKNYHNDDFLINVAMNNPEEYPSGITGYEQYYVDLEGFWRDLYQLNEQNNKWEFVEDVRNYPERLNFWFDFLDGDLDQYNVKTAGRRPKDINDNEVKAIYYRQIPEVLFQVGKGTTKLDQDAPGYTKLQLTQAFSGLFTISSMGKSAMDKVNDFLYQYSYCMETATINAIPVYYLEPNTRIAVQDDRSGICGEYMVDKITIPLAYNGTMSITATKAVDNITY